jgi:hypothetical protein
MTTFIREQETKEIMNKYTDMSTQELLDYLMSHHYDGDCQYIFSHLPKDLQDDIDALAGETVKIRDQQISNVKKLTEYVDRHIADVQEFNKRLRAENYQIECEIENVRDIRRQLTL